MIRGNVRSLEPVCLILKQRVSRENSRGWSPGGVEKQSYYYRSYGCDLFGRQRSPQVNLLADQTVPRGDLSPELVSSEGKDIGRVFSSVEIVALPLRAAGLPIVALEVLLAGNTKTTTLREFRTMKDGCHWGRRIAPRDVIGLEVATTLHARVEHGLAEPASVASIASAFYFSSFTGSTVERYNCGYSLGSPPA